MHIPGFSRPGDDPPAPKKPAGSGIGAWVVHKSSQLIAFDKPAALAVQTAREGAPSLQRLASAYAKRDLYLLHRIDQPASGLVLFGRHAKKAADLQRQFADGGGARREYLVVADAVPEGGPGALTHHLLRDGRANKTRVVDAGTPDAREATLTWELAGRTERYPVLRVWPATAVHHQVRAQLAAAGAPVHGDVKYGARRANPDRSIHLHAHRLTLRHPVSGEELTLEAPLPSEDALWAAAGAVLG